MDWFQILMLLVFFGLPLLGKLMEKGQPPTLPPVGQGEALPPAPRPRVFRVEDVSGGWEEWPSGDEEAPGVLSTAEESQELHTAEAVSLEPLAPEAVRVRPGRALPSEPMSVEVLEVDWEAEQRRFHQRYLERKGEAPPARHGAFPDLRGDRAALRRAMLLSEVLGPPKALEG